jgi:hypothetical protein
MNECGRLNSEFIRMIDYFSRTKEISDMGFAYGRHDFITYLVLAWFFCVPPGFGRNRV